MDGLYRSYAALLLSALLPIVAGAHVALKASRQHASSLSVSSLTLAALQMPRAARKELRALEGKDAEDDEDEDEEEVDRLTVSADVSREERWS